MRLDMSASPPQPLRQPAGLQSPWLQLRQSPPPVPQPLRPGPAAPPPLQQHQVPPPMARGEEGDPRQAIHVAPPLLGMDSPPLLGLDASPLGGAAAPPLGQGREQEQEATFPPPQNYVTALMEPLFVAIRHWNLTRTPLHFTPGTERVVYGHFQPHNWASPETLAAAGLVRVQTPPSDDDPYGFGGATPDPNDMIIE